MKQVALGLVRLYQRAVSPHVGASCRYLPTCSQYAMEAIERHGVVKGCGMTVKRLLRCHPWTPGGYDPVH